MFILVFYDIFLSCYTGVGDRIWCGDGANPPGIFAAFLIDINPVKYFDKSSKAKSKASKFAS
jgi:hypothetical protein